MREPRSTRRGRKAREREEEAKEQSERNRAAPEQKVDIDHRARETTVRGAITEAPEEEKNDEPTAAAEH